MTKSLRFHHIGILTANLEAGINVYMELGFSSMETPVIVPSQKVRVCMMQKAGEPLVELIEPYGPDSPLSGYLSRHGAGPYHICFSCENIEETIAALRKNKFRIISEKDDSQVLGIYSRIFVYKKETGLMEIIEEHIH